MCHTAKADAADAKRAHKATRASAQLAAVLVARRQLGCRILAHGFGDFRFFCHCSFRLLNGFSGRSWPRFEASLTIPQ